MKVLVIGSGGREHAIAWKLAQDNRISRIYIAPGNAGTEMLQHAENVNLTKIDELYDFAIKRDISLTIVGSESWLVDGIVDKFKSAGLTIFGPHQAAAMLEGSKKYAKAFMQKYGVKTAKYESFDDLEKALSYLTTCPYPTVVKASGLAAGKGVIICQNQTEAEAAVREMMANSRFGEAGKEIVIEEFLEGFEVSVLSFCDGENIIPMRTAKDHKAIGENNTGENTGGMGVVAPHPTISDAQYQQFIEDIMQPTLRGIQAENLKFAGIIFFGLMINARGVFLLEYNMRFGDPETQAILPLMKTSLLDAIVACLNAKLSELQLKWEDKCSVCVVAASQGYPNQYDTGFVIHHIEKANFFSQVFIAGAQKNNNHDIVTSGGRVLNTVGIGNSIEEAKNQAYSGMQQIQFEGMIYRKDIGSFEVQ